MGDDIISLLSCNLLRISVFYDFLTQEKNFFDVVGGFCGMLSGNFGEGGGHRLPVVGAGDQLLGADDVAGASVVGGEGKFQTLQAFLAFENIPHSSVV